MVVNHVKHLILWASASSLEVSVTWNENPQHWGCPSQAVQTGSSEGTHRGFTAQLGSQVGLAGWAVCPGHTTIASCAEDPTVSCRQAYPGLQSPLRLSNEWESSAILGLCPFLNSSFSWAYVKPILIRNRALSVGSFILMLPDSKQNVH